MSTLTVATQGFVGALDTIRWASGRYSEFLFSFRIRGGLNRRCASAHHDTHSGETHKMHRGKIKCNKAVRRRMYPGATRDGTQPHNTRKCDRGRSHLTLSEPFTETESENPSLEILSHMGALAPNSHLSGEGISNIPNRCVTFLRIVRRRCYGNHPLHHDDIRDRGSLGNGQNPLPHQLRRPPTSPHGRHRRRLRGGVGAGSTRSTLEDSAGDIRGEGSGAVGGRQSERHRVGGVFQA